MIVSNDSHCGRIIHSIESIKDHGFFHNSSHQCIETLSASTIFFFILWKRTLSCCDLKSTFVGFSNNDTDCRLRTALLTRSDDLGGLFLSLCGILYSEHFELPSISCFLLFYSIHSTVFSMYLYIEVDDSPHSSLAIT